MILKEKPDSVLPTLGGQAGLNLPRLPFGLAVAVSRRAAAKEQERQKKCGQSVKLLHCITSVMS